MKTPAEILRGAAEYLETYGWAQGTFGTPHGPACMLGAMRMAAGSQSPQLPPAALDDKRAYNAAKHIIKPHIGWKTIDAWNDQDDRAPAEVITVLRESAEDAECKS